MLLNVISEIMEYLQFDRYSETWWGEWKKDGIEYPYYNTVDIMNCEFCLNDYIRRKKRSLLVYRVVGVTSPDSCYDWSHYSVCRNPVDCWGSDGRSWTVLRGYKTDQWVFKSSAISSSGHRTLVDELRVNLEQGSGQSRLLYTGICTARKSSQFFPWVKKETGMPVMKVLVKVKSGEPTPPNKRWYENLSYMYPNHIQLRCFEPSVGKGELASLEKVVKDPQSEDDLETHWNKIRKSSNTS